MKNINYLQILFAYIIIVCELTVSVSGQNFPQVNYLSNNQVNALYERDITLNPTIGRLNGTVDVSPTGASSYTIPLFVSPGTAGIQPGLSVIYNSQVGNGIMGMGWNPSCFSLISRVQQTYYNDLNVQPVNGSDEDRFTLDGNRLVEVPGGSGDTKLYRTELETFSKITRTNDANNGLEFKVETKDGKTLYYGSTTDSKVHGYNYPASMNPPFIDMGIYLWRLNKVVDANGNYFEYFYNTTSLSNNSTESILEKIEYTKNDGSSSISINAIKFNYGLREDKYCSYFAGCKMSQSLLLTSIEIYCNESAVRTYHFNYALDTYSHLVEIKESASTDYLNSTVIKWGDEKPDFEVFDLTDNLPKNDIYIGDFNGDGLSDLVTILDIPNTSNSKLHVYLSNSNNNPSLFQLTYIEQLDYQPNLDFSRIGDLNADGIDDILFAFDDNGNTKYDALITPGTSLSPSNPFQHLLIQNSFQDVKATFIGNFNSDGYPDIFIANDDYQFSILKIANNGQTYSIPYWGLINYHWWDKVYVLDFDGDGLMEILNLNTPGWDNGRIYKFNNNQLQTIVTIMPWNTGSNSDIVLYIGDLNGDGKSDLIWRTDNEQDGLTASYSNGKDFEYRFYVGPLWDVFCTDLVCKEDYRIFIGDYNGDGKSDILHIVPRENHCYNDPDPGGPLIHQYYITYIINYSIGSHHTPNPGGYEQGDFKTELFNENSHRDGNDHCYHFGDFNGDGSIEMFYNYWYFPHYNNNPPKIYYFHRDEQKHLPSFIMDGFNLRTWFSFTTLSKGTNYLRGTNAINPIVIDWNGPMKVTASLRVPDGVGSSNVTNYYYKGAKIHLQGKGFIGFTDFIRTNTESNIEISSHFSFLPNYYYNVLENSKSTHLQSGDISLTENRWTTYDFNDHRFYPYVLNQASKNFLKLTYNISTFDIDVNGNTQLSTSINSSSDGQSYIEDGHTDSYFHFINPNPGGPGNTIPYLCDRSEVIQTNGQGSFKKITKYEYDLKGNLKLEKDVNPSDENDLYRMITYDRANPFGLINTITTSSPNLPLQPSIEYKYDQYNKFITKKINCLGHEVFTKTYDEPTGNVLIETDINLNITTYLYDNFGKLIKIVVPSDLGYPTTISSSWVTTFSAPFPCTPIYKTETKTFQDQNLIYYQTSTTYFDCFDREIQNEQDVFSNTTIKKVLNTKLYNNLGQLISESQPYFNTDQIQNIKWKDYHYNDFGQLDLETFNNLSNC